MQRGLFMSIPFNFTYKEVQHKAYLEVAESALEKMVSIEGRDYKILGSEENISLLRSHIPSLKTSDFESVSSFQASLVGIGPHEKTNSVFQKTIVSSSEVVEIEEQEPVDLESINKKIEETLPPSAGAMVVVYERGKQLTPICVGQTSVTDTLNHYKILLSDIQKQIEVLESQEKESGPDKARQEKIKGLGEKINHFKKEIAAQESARPVDMQTAALIGSGAKMFTALLSKVLCERGDLSLKSKLSDFLNEEHFQIFEDPESAKQVTLEMLLSHTSGFQYFSDDNNNARKGQSLDAIFSDMRPKGIRFIASPGDGIYSYSNQIELAAVFIEKSYKKKLVKDLIKDGVISGDQPVKQLEPTRQKLQEKIDKAEKHIAYLKNKRDHVSKGSSGRAKKGNLNTQIEAHEARLKTLKSDFDKIPKTVQDLLQYPSAYVQDIYVYKIFDELLAPSKKHQTTYADIMKAELLDQLGMTRTSFEKPEDPNVLRAYRGGSSFDTEILDPLMRGAGGLWSCMGDMVKLVEAYGENGLQTSSGTTLISSEGLKDLAQNRGVNGNTGLGINVDGSIVGKGGSVASYGFTLKMDPSKGNAVISMCNFIDDRSNFDPFAEIVKGTLDGMYPKKEAQKTIPPKLTEKEARLALEGFPISQCDIFFKGDRGFVGIKRTETDPWIILNWNGQTLPVRKLGKDRYLIIDDGYPGGQVLRIFKGKKTGKSYVIIEKGEETNAFQGIPKSTMFFPRDADFLKDVSGARGTYQSTIKGGPTFKFEIDDSPNCRLSLGEFPPVTGLVTKIVKDGDERTAEVFLQGNCGPFPPDKLFKISRGDVVRAETSQELAQQKLELEELRKKGPSEKITPLEKRIADLEKQLLAQKNITWFFRVADFVNSDVNIEAIPLTKSVQSGVSTEFGL